MKKNIDWALSISLVLFLAWALFSDGGFLGGF